VIHAEIDTLKQIAIVYGRRLEQEQQYFVSLSGGSRKHTQKAEQRNE